mmetsp:Transcript_8128/g.23189  ORF Transcript_8128/g.23189 Transcript_8128/m.23189 type:complete len:106 (-) Transcript_8128:2-319(-)
MIAASASADDDVDWAGALSGSATPKTLQMLEVAEEQSDAAESRMVGPIIDTEEVAQQCSLATPPRSVSVDAASSIASVFEGMHSSMEESFGRLKGTVENFTSFRF